MTRIVAHIDMDAFFASVEERDNPRFRGLPLVVGADPEGGHGRGVVSTANYKAREYGIRSALPISKAWKCSEAARSAGKPPAVFLGVAMEKYADVSRRIRALILRHVSRIEQASIDEFYCEMDEVKTFMRAEARCRALKREICAEERLTCSVGIGPNKLVAKIASDFEKPDGMTVVSEGEARDFLGPLSVRKIPGVGPKTELLLRARGIATVSDLMMHTRETMVELLGKWGEDLYDKARGVDESPVTEEYETKSIGEQETFPHDTRDTNTVTERLQALARGVHASFLASGFSRFRTVCVTVRFDDFETKSRAHTLARPARDGNTIEFEAMKLLFPFLDSRENPRRKPIRLVGVRIEKLS